MRCVVLLFIATMMTSGCGATLHGAQLSLPSKADGSGPDLSNLPRPTGIRFYGSKLYRLTTYVCLPKDGATAEPFCEWKIKGATTQVLPNPYTIYELNYSGGLGKNSLKVLLNPDGTLQSVRLNAAEATQQPLQIIEAGKGAFKKGAANTGQKQ